MIIVLKSSINTWYPFHSGFGGGTPWVGENIIGTNGAGSFNALGEDQDAIFDCDAPCNGTDPPFPYPEGDSYPPAAVGSGWLNLQFAPYLHEPVRM